MVGILRGKVIKENYDLNGFEYKIIESNNVTYRFDKRVRGDQFGDIPVGAEIVFKTELSANGKPYACWVRAADGAREEEKPEGASGGDTRPQKRQRPMFSWGFFLNYYETLNRLRDMALAETWNFGQQNDEYPAILNNYLHRTFERLQYENKIMMNNSYAAFNTGLVDRKYAQIHCMFKKNFKGASDWFFWDFAVEAEEMVGKELVRQFNPLPQRAKYFGKISECLYESADMPQCDFPHILLERIDRLPYEFVCENCPSGFEPQRTERMDNAERREYREDFARRIDGDYKKLRSMINRLSDSVKLAMKRVEWDYKTAIPMYFPRYKTMSLLLPIALVDDERADAALVVEKTQSGSYLGHTVLTLDMAYNNARLITRPNSDWLKTEVASSEHEEEYED